MKSIFTLFIAAAIAASAPAPQKDPKAEAILEQVSAFNKSKKTMNIDFSFNLKKGDEMDETQKGNLKLEGNKYRYSLFGVTKISDGKAITTVSEGEEEVIIVDANFNDPDEFSPQEMFTIYEQGYKYRFINEVQENGKTLNVIDLYPDTGNKQPYRRVTLYVDKTTHEMVKIVLVHKTSSKILTITVNKAQYDQTFDAKTFNVECSNWPDFDCDDQRGAE